MSKTKKTIQIANGIAEEGDRVKWKDRGVSGVDVTYSGFVKISKRTGDWVFQTGFAQRSVDDIGKEDLFIAFSPTDALEAVEEACNTLLTQLEAIDHNSEVRKEAFKAMREEAKATINQKRKGHE